MSLEVENLLGDDADEAQTLLNKLMLQSNTDGEESAGGKPWVQIIPRPGFCLKTKKESGEKVFINVCQDDNVPKAREMTEEELLKLLDSDDPFGFRVPMSIGEPHAELDKSGQGCTAYDVVVHPSFLEKMLKSEVFRAFFLSVTLEGLEEKYNTTLSREWVILKNRKSVGKLQEQAVRKQSKPQIMEMGEDGTAYPTQSLGTNKPLIQEVDPSKPLTKEELKARGQEPEYSIIQEPLEGHPEFLVAEISLPQVKVASTMTVDIGEDRILLQTRSNKYYLDIYLPFHMIQEDCAAQFNRKTRILTLTIPVQPER